jgi:hypothetical protein
MNNNRIVIRDEEKHRCKIFSISTQGASFTGQHKLRLKNSIQNLDSTTIGSDDFVLVDGGTVKAVLIPKERGYVFFSATVLCKIREQSDWEALNETPEQDIEHCSMIVVLDITSISDRQILYFWPLIEMFHRVILVAPSRDPFLRPFFKNRTGFNPSFSVTTLFVDGQFSSLTTDTMQPLGTARNWVNVLGKPEEEIKTLCQEVLRKTYANSGFIRTLVLLKKTTSVDIRQHLKWPAHLHIHQVFCTSLVFAEDHCDFWEYFIDRIDNAANQSERFDFPFARTVITNDQTVKYDAYVFNVAANLVQWATELLIGSNRNARVAVCSLGHICKKSSWNYRNVVLQDIQFSAIYRGRPQMVLEPPMTISDQTLSKISRKRGQMVMPLPVPETQEDWNKFATETFCSPISLSNAVVAYKLYRFKLGEVIMILHPFNLPVYVLLWILEYVEPEANYFSEAKRIRTIEITKDSCTRVLSRRPERQVVQKIEQ